VIARLDVERHQLAALVPGLGRPTAITSPSGFSFAGRDDNPTFGFQIAFSAPDDGTVVEWPEFHCDLSAADGPPPFQSAFGTRVTGFLKLILAYLQNTSMHNYQNQEICDFSSLVRLL
jgi:hypothetical protein